MRAQSSVGEHKVRATPKYPVVSHSPVTVIYSGTDMKNSEGLCQARTIKRGYKEFSNIFRTPWKELWPLVEVKLEGSSKTEWRGRWFGDLLQ